MFEFCQLSAESGNCASMCLTTMELDILLPFPMSAMTYPLRALLKYHVMGMDRYNCFCLKEYPAFSLADSSLCGENI